MHTVFFEDFLNTTVNRSVWEVVNDYKRDLGVLIDSPLTLAVNNGNLELKMLYSPGYDAGQYSGDYIGAEIITNTRYLYGSFECRAKFAYQNGSWPAFWLIGGDAISCQQGGKANEIDIAELKCEDALLTIDHVIHYYYAPSQCDGEQQNIHYYSGMSFDNNYHLFKCVWSPDKIDFYVDGIFTHQVLNSGQNWYPSRYLHVYLSQQIIDPLGAVITPQTSYFDYVRVKQFFLSPVITAPGIICSTGTATLDVDPLASNITWQLTPSSLFATSSGTGKTANIVRAAGAIGTGNIKYTFQMPGGESFTANKDILIGTPPMPVLTGPVSPRCDYTYTYRVDNISDSESATYYWESDILEIANPTSRACTAWPTIDGEGTISCTVTACGVSVTESKYVLAKLCTEYEVKLFPNPSSDAVEVSLTKKIPADGTEAQEDDGATGHVDPVFNVRVSSQMGTAVYNTKTTSKKFTIPVNNFQNGNYYLDVNDNKNSYRKQFIVKH